MLLWLRLLYIKCFVLLVTVYNTTRQSTFKCLLLVCHQIAGHTVWWYQMARWICTVLLHTVGLNPSDVSTAQAILTEFFGRRVQFHSYVFVCTACRVTDTSVFVDTTCRLSRPRNGCYSIKPRFQLPYLLSTFQLPLLFVRTASCRA